MSAKHTFLLKGVRREVGKKVATDGGRGFRTVSDGYEIADLELTVDLEALARKLGAKAMRNVSGRSTIAWGLVKVRVAARKRFPGGGS